MKRRSRLILVGLLILALLGTASALAADSPKVALTKVDILEQVFTIDGSVEKADGNELYLALYSAQGQMLGVQEVTLNGGTFRANFPGITAQEGDYEVRTFLVDPQKSPKAPIARHLVRYVTTDGAVIRSLDGVDDLVIGEAVGDGTVTLDGVKMKDGGALHIHGGGEHSVRLINRSEVGNLTISKSGDGNLRVYTEEGSRVEVIVIDDGKDDIYLEGSYNKLSVNTAAPVTLRGASVSSLEVNAEDAKVAAQSDNTGKPSSVSVVTVTADATGTELTVEGDSKLAFVDTSADNVAITGSGAITQVTASASTTVTLTNTAAETTVVATGNAEVTNNGVKVESKSENALLAQVKESALAEVDAIEPALYAENEKVNGLVTAARNSIDAADALADVAASLADLNDALSRLALAADVAAVTNAKTAAEAVAFQQLSAAIYNSEDAVKGYVSGVLSGLQLNGVRATIAGAQFTPAVGSTAGSYAFKIQLFKGEAIAETDKMAVTIAYSVSPTPAAPTVLQRSAESVILNPIPGAEYCCGSGSWQDSNVFSDLNPGTAYTFQVRIKATDDTLASEAASAEIYTLPTAPAVSEVKLNYADETVTYDDEFELLNSSGTVIDSGLDITSYIGKTLSIRRRAAGDVPASDQVAVSIPARPAAPANISAENGVLVGVNSQMEYRTAGADTYTAINGPVQVAAGNYLVRYRATSTAFASEETTVAVAIEVAEVTSFEAFKAMVANDAVKSIRITGSFAVTENIQCAKNIDIAAGCTLTIDPDVEMTMFSASGTKKITGEGTIMDNGYLWLDFVCPDQPTEDFYPIDPVVLGEGEISLRAYATTMKAIKWSLEAAWVNTISVIDVTNETPNITLTEDLTITKGKTLNVGRHPIGDEAVPAHTLTIGKGVALRVEDGRLQAVNGGSIVIEQGGALVNEAQTVVFGAENTIGEEFVNNGTIENRGEFILQGAKMVNNGTINGKKDADGNNFVSAFYAIYDSVYSFQGAEFINNGTLAERVLIGDQLGAEQMLSKGENTGTGTFADDGGLVYAADAYVDNAADLNAILNGDKHYDEIYVVSPVYDEEVIPAFTAEADITIPEGVSVIFQRPVTVSEGVTMTVADGGSAEFQYETTVNGSLVNNERAVITEDATLTVNGSFTANDFVGVAPGSTLNVNGTYTMNAPFMQNEGSISVRGTFTVGANSVIQGVWNDEGEYYESTFALEFDLVNRAAGKLVNNGRIDDQIILCDYYNGENDQLVSIVEGSTEELMIQRLTYVSDPGLIQTCLDREDIYEVVLINTANGRPLFSAATTLQPFVLPEELTVPENKTLVANNTVILGDYVYWMGSLVIPENAQFTVHGGLFVGSKLENNGTLDVYGYFEQTHPRVITNNGTLNMMGEGFLYDDGENQGTLVNNGNVVIDGLLWVIDAPVTGNPITGEGRIVFGDNITAPMAGDVIFTINAGSLDTIYNGELLDNPHLRNIIVGGGAVKPESLPADLTIPEHVSLRVHPDLTLIVPADITLTVEGELNLNGPIDLKGTLEIAEGAYVFANNQLTNTGAITMAAGSTLELDGDYTGGENAITYADDAAIIVLPGHKMTGLPADIVQERYPVTNEAELREALSGSGRNIEIAEHIQLTDDLTVGSGNTLRFLNWDNHDDAYSLDLNGNMLTVSANSTVIVGHGCVLDATNAALDISGEVIVDRGDLYFYSQQKDGLRIREGGKLRLERDGRLAIGLWNDNGAFPSADGSINNEGIISTAYGRFDIHTEEDHEVEQIIVGNPVLQFVQVSSQQQLAAALNDPWLRNIRIVDDLTLDRTGPGTHAGEDNNDTNRYFHIDRSDEGIDRYVELLPGKTLTVPQNMLLTIGEGCELALTANEGGYAVLQVKGGVDVLGGVNPWHDWNEQILVDHDNGAWFNQFIDAISFAQKLEERLGSAAREEWYDSRDWGDPVNWPHWDDRQGAYRLLIGICGEERNGKYWEPYRMLTWGEALDRLNTFWTVLADLGWTEGSFPVGLPEGCQPDWLLTHPDTDWLLDDLFAKISFPRTEDYETTTILATHPEGENRYFENITFKKKITIRVDPNSDNWECGPEWDDRGEYTYAYTTVHFRNCAFEGGLEIIQDNDGVIESENGYIDCRLELNVRFENCQLITDGITVSAGQDVALDPFSDYDRVAIDGVPAGQQIVSSVHVAVNNSSDFTLNGIRVTGPNANASLNLECYADHGENGDYNAFDHFKCDHTNNPIFARIHTHDQVESITVVSKPTFAGHPINRYEANSDRDVALSLGTVTLEDNELLRLWAQPYWHDEERGEWGGGHKMTVHGTVSGGTVELNGGNYDVTGLDYSASRLTVGTWDPNIVRLNGNAELAGGSTDDFRPEFYAVSGSTITAPEPEQAVVVHTTVEDFELTYDADTPHIFGGNGIYLGWGKDDFTTANVYKRTDDGWTQLTVTKTEFFDDDGDDINNKVHFTGEGDSWFQPGDQVCLEIVWNGVTIRYENLWYKEADERTVNSADELQQAAQEGVRIKLGANIELTGDVRIYQDLDLNGYTLTVPSGKTFVMDGNSGFFSGVNGGAIINNGTLDLLRMENWIDLRGGRLENYGRLVNNGYIYIESGLLKHDSNEVFENSGNIELVGGEFDLSDAKKNSFKNVRYMKIVDVYTGVEGNDQICNISSEAFSALTEDSNWLDYTARVSNAQALADAAAAQAEKRGNTVEDRDQYKGFDYYNRLDLYGNFEIAGNLTLSGFDTIWLENTYDEEGEHPSTLTVMDGATLTVAESCLCVNGDATLTIEQGGTLALAAGQDEIRDEHGDITQHYMAPGRIELWPYANFINEGTVENHGEFYIREEWNAEEEAFLPGGEIMGEPSNTLYIAHIYDEDQLRAAAGDEKHDILHIREGGSDPDGNHIYVNENLTISKQVDTDSNSGLYIEEGVTLTFSGPYDYNNHGDISVFGTLVLTDGYQFHNHNHIEVGDVATNAEAGVTARLLVENGAWLHNGNHLQIHGSGLLACEGGRFEGNSPEYDEDGGDPVINTLTSDATTLDIAGGGIGYMNITFTKPLTITGNGDILFRSCHFNGGLTCALEKDKYQYIELFDGCTVYENVISTVPASDAFDLYNNDHRVELRGHLNGLTINAAVPTQVAMHEQGSFTLNGVTLTGYGDDWNSFDGNVFLNRYGEEEDAETGAVIAFSGPLTTVSVNNNATFGGALIREFQVHDAWGGAESDITLALGELNRENATVRITNYFTTDDLILTGTVTADRLELNGIGVTDISSVSCTDEIYVGEWDEDNTVILGAGQTVTTGGRYDNRTIFYAQSGNTIDVWEYNSGVEVRTGDEQVFSPGAPHIFEGNGVFLGWGQEDIEVNLFVWSENEWVERENFTIEYLDGDGDGFNDKVHLTRKDEGEWFTDEQVRLQVSWNGITINYMDLYRKPDTSSDDQTDVQTETQPDTSSDDQTDAQTDPQ